MPPVRFSLSACAFELIPHLGDWRFGRIIERDRNAAPEPHDAEGHEYGEYAMLERNELMTRLREEHAHAEKLDEKTIRLLAIPTLGLALLGLAGPAIVGDLSPVWLRYLVVAFGILAGAFLLDAAYLSLNSMRVQILFGFGSRFLLDLHNADTEFWRQRYLAKDLWSQEKMNHRRSIRNEAVYMTLRNGFLSISIAVAFAVGGLIAEHICV